MKLEPCPNPWCRPDYYRALYHNPTGAKVLIECLCGVHSPYAENRDEAIKLWNTRAPHPSHAAVEAMAQALEKARPILESELQSMCESYCPPCKEGDVFDYSKLKQPELGWITATEEALDNTDAALDAYRATQNKDARP